MVDVLDDPFDSIKQFNAVIEKHEDTSNRAVKDKSVIVSIKPINFYIRNFQMFEDATMYYTQMLNEKYPNDSDLEASNIIRKKRMAYIGNLMKILKEIDIRG